MKEYAEMATRIRNSFTEKAKLLDVSNDLMIMGLDDEHE